MIAEALGKDVWYIENNYTSEDIAYWMAYFKIKNADSSKPSKGLKGSRRKSIPRRSVRKR